MRRSTFAASVLAVCLRTIAAAAGATPPEAALPPELASVEAASHLGMVVSGSPDASLVGARVLAEGGNAIDAAVATAFAVGVSEPSQSGLGGQTYLLLRLADGRAIAIDGSALAPIRVDRERLKSMAQLQERNGHALAATPGTVAALAHALECYGTRTLAELLAPAIELAEFGTRWTALQRRFLEHYIARVRQADYLSRLYLGDAGDPWGPAHVYCDPNLARTLWRLAAHGANDFYRGAIAQEISDDMRRNGGFVGLADLAAMRAVEREPLRGSYRGLEVLAFPEPCAGGAVIEELHILERFSPELLRSDSVDRIHVLLEAARLAMDDENQVRSLVPEASQPLVSKRHAASRAALIRFDRTLSDEVIWRGSGGAWKDRDTTHISVIDRFGNAVALTQTLGRGFGSCAVTPGLGFIYNGILEGFEAERTTSRFYLAPLRPLFSSLAPTIVTRGGRPFLVLGSAGTSRIAPSIVAVIINVVDAAMGLGTAQSAPRALWSGSDDRDLIIEVAPPISAATVSELAARGFRAMTTVTFPPQGIDLSRAGGVNAILVTPEGAFVGVCDPRRGGLATGPEDARSQAPVARPAAAYWSTRFGRRADDE